MVAGMAQDECSGCERPIVMRPRAALNCGPTGLHDPHAYASDEVARRRQRMG